MGTTPQQFGGILKGLSAIRGALRSSRYVLEQSHEDDRRWVVVGRFMTRGDAEAALAAIVERDRRYRIRKIQVPR